MALPCSCLLLSVTIAFTVLVLGDSIFPKIETLNKVLEVDEKEPSEPSPVEWPEQFHAVLVMNNSKTSKLQVIDLWYDWPNGRNLNLIQNQLGKLLHDVEWNNGTSYYYTLGVGSDEGRECKTMHFEVGILRPNWLEGANYMGQSYVNGFLCNVWEKVDFIWYYEDVLTKRPVHWLFFTGMSAHVMTFEVGAVLEDSKWQAPVYCFDEHAEQQGTPPEEAGIPRPTMAVV